MLLALLLLVNEPLCSTIFTRLDHYGYVEDLSVEYSHSLGAFTYNGHLDATGQFIPDPANRISNLSMGGTGPILRPFLFKATHGEKLYQFQGGRLIPGVIKSQIIRQGATGTDNFKSAKKELHTWFFYPDLNGKIIEMQEYLNDFDPAKSPRIFNLPGRILKKSNDK